MVKLQLTHKQAKEVLRVSSNRTWRSHLNAIGIGSTVTILDWSQLEALYALQLYLSVRTGQHSKSEFAQIYREKGLTPIKDTIRSHGFHYDQAVQLFIETLRRFKSELLETELLEISNCEEK